MDSTTLGRNILTLERDGDCDRTNESGPPLQGTPLDQGGRKALSGGDEAMVAGAGSKIRLHLRYQGACRPADNAPGRRSQSSSYGGRAQLLSRRR